MRWSIVRTAAVAAGFLVAATGIAHVRAAADLVKFPDNYASGVLYGTVDRADNKQFRELYANKEAVDAARAGQPLPSGTVLTMKTFKAKLDEKGEPMKGPDGRFINSGDLVGYAVMEKRAGWGGEYPVELRNGEWEYQAFTATKAINSKANLKGCFECHKPHESKDYVFSMDKLKGAK
jgi:hypothetical protein